MQQTGDVSFPIILAEFKYEPTKSENDHEDIFVPLNEIPKYLYVQNETKFYFADNESAKSYNEAYQAFKDRTKHL